MAAPTRSTKAGAHTPATPAGSLTLPVRPASLNEGRGAYPGDTCYPIRWCMKTRPLNEGRGAYPGDTRSVPCCPVVSLRRSTKAGAHTPATLRTWEELPACS